jgi:hypothetical protein
MANSHRVFEGPCCFQHSSNYLSVDRQYVPKDLLFADVCTWIRSGECARFVAIFNTCFQIFVNAHEGLRSDTISQLMFGE